MSEINENKIYYWLSMSGMGSKKLNAALTAFSADEIYNDLPSSKPLRKFFGEKYYDILISSRDSTYLDNNLEKIVKLNIRILTLANPKYPLTLKQSEVSPPIILYYQGDLGCISDNPCIAIVGTRTVSQYGKDVAKKFAADFAGSGVTVVSGLATGVDSYAHDAAAEVGKTAAVLGGGHKHIATYSLNLAEKILGNKGAIFSEYPPDFIPTKYTFPERNRIISGISSAVVVIEAGEKSGALITADYALEQGREIYAVPGNIFSTKSVGSNRLIKNAQASIALSAKDIMTDLRINFDKTAQKDSYISLDIYEQKIYNLLQSGQKHVDELIKDSGISAAELAGILFSLQLKGIIRRLVNNIYTLKGDE